MYRLSLFRSRWGEEAAAGEDLRPRKNHQQQHGGQHGQGKHYTDIRTYVQTHKIIGQHTMQAHIQTDRQNNRQQHIYILTYR